MEKFSQPMATVVSTIILVLGLLVAFKTGGSEPQKNYAFVNFDGGFEAIKGLYFGRQSRDLIQRQVQERQILITSEEIRWNRFYPVVAQILVN